MEIVDVIYTLTTAYSRRAPATLAGHGFVNGSDRRSPLGAEARRATARVMVAARVMSGDGVRWGEND